MPQREEARILDVTSRVKELIQAHCGVESADIENHQDLIKDLGVDSLDVVEIILDVEGAFDIQCSWVETEAVETVQDVINLVLYKTRGR